MGVPSKKTRDEKEKGMFLEVELDLHLGSRDLEVKLDPHLNL